MGDVELAFRIDRLGEGGGDEAAGGGAEDIDDRDHLGERRPGHFGDLVGPGRAADVAAVGTAFGKAAEQRLRDMLAARVEPVERLVGMVGQRVAQPADGVMVGERQCASRAVAGERRGVAVVRHLIRPAG